MQHNNGNLKQKISTQDLASEGIDYTNSQDYVWDSSRSTIDRGSCIIFPNLVKIFNLGRTRELLTWEIPPSGHYANGSDQISFISLFTPAREDISHIHGTSLGHFQLVDLEWRSRFELVQYPIGSHYIIYLPFAGVLEQQLDRHQTVSCSPDTATIANPGQESVGIASEEGQALLIGIDRDSIEQALAKLLNRSPKRPLVFDPKY